MFLEESLFIPREKGQVRWQTVAISLVRGLMHCLYPPHAVLWILPMGLGKSYPRASLFLLPCLGGQQGTQCSCPASPPEALFVACCPIRDWLTVTQQQ